MPEERILITIEESLKLISCGRSYFYTLLSAGDIRSVKAGRRRLVVVDSLKQWAQNLPSDGLTQKVSE